MDSLRQSHKKRVNSPIPSLSIISITQPPSVSQDVFRWWLNIGWPRKCSIVSRELSALKGSSLIHCFLNSPIWIKTINIRDTIKVIKWMLLIVAAIQSNGILQANGYCLDQQRHNYRLCPWFVLYIKKYIFIDKSIWWHSLIWILSAWGLFPEKNKVTF